MTEFNKFLLWELQSRDIIDFKKIYVDMTGDLVAGLLLSELVYWYLPSKKGQENKLRVHRDDKYWIACKRIDWWERTRLSPKQIDRAVKIMEQLSIVESAVYKFGGELALHLRLIEDKFLELWQYHCSHPIDNPYVKLPKGQNIPKGKMQIAQKVTTLYTETSLTKNTNHSANASAAKAANRVADNEIISLQSLTSEQAALLRDIEAEQSITFTAISEFYSLETANELERLELIERHDCADLLWCYQMTTKGVSLLQEPIKAEKPVKTKGRKPAYVLTDADKQILQFVEKTPECYKGDIEVNIDLPLNAIDILNLLEQGYLQVQPGHVGEVYSLTDKGRKAIGAKKPVSDKQLENNRKADIALAYGEWLGTEKDIAALRNMTKTLAESLPDLTGQELKDFFSVQTGLNKNLKRMDSIMRELVIWRAGKANSSNKTGDYSELHKPTPKWVLE